MNFKLKDFIVVAVVMVASFPVLYFVMMLATGMARVEFGSKDKVVVDEKKVEIVKSTSRKDSLAIVNSRTFLALQQEKDEIAKERKRLQEQQSRMEITERDLEAQKNELSQERKKIERAIESSDSLDRKKIQSLSKVYAAMKPAEASQIIETLDDELALKIVTGITDDRQKAKILSLVSREKASRMSKLLSEKGLK